MTFPASDKGTKKKLLKLDEKAHDAQARADKLQRKALDSGKNKKAKKAQTEADKKAGEAASALED